MIELSWMTRCLWLLVNKWDFISDTSQFLLALIDNLRIQIKLFFDEFLLA